MKRSFVVAGLVLAQTFSGECKMSIADAIDHNDIQAVTKLVLKEAPFTKEQKEKLSKAVALSVKQYKAKTKDLFSSTADKFRLLAGMGLSGTGAIMLIGGGLSAILSEEFRNKGRMGLGGSLVVTVIGGVLGFFECVN